MTDDVQDSAAALLSMSSGGGKLSTPVKPMSPVKRSQRQTKRTKRYDDEDRVGPPPPAGFGGSSGGGVHTSVLPGRPVLSGASPAKRAAVGSGVLPPATGLQNAATALMKANFESLKKVGSQLKNLLKLPKAHHWVCYEWFYSNIDEALFRGENDFEMVLRQNFPRLKTRKLRRMEWCKVRQLIGKPRRCSPKFFREELEILNRKREKIRLLQQRKVTELSPEDLKDLPQSIPMPLVIGTEVTALLRTGLQDGLFTGVVEAIDTSTSTYRIRFIRSNMGTHSIPDTDVRSNADTIDSIPISTFAAKQPTRLPQTPPSHGTISLEKDPVLGVSPLTNQRISVENGIIGGFRVKFLHQIMTIIKLLQQKKDLVDQQRDMNSMGERMQARCEPVSPDFQRRYAHIILSLEECNTCLKAHFESVSVFCDELAREHDIGLDDPAKVRDTCDIEADFVIQGLKMKVKGDQTRTLVTRLTSLLLQLKTFGEGDQGTHEFQGLQESIDMLKDSIGSASTVSFRNNVEVHVNHIRNNFSQSGGLQAFSDSTMK